MRIDDPGLPAVEIEVGPIAVGTTEWVEIIARAGRVSRSKVSSLLAANFELAVGGVCLDDEVLAVRQTLPAATRPDVVVETVECVARLAAALRSEQES